MNEYATRLSAAESTSASTPRVKSPAQEVGAKRRILVVDDNKDSGDTLSLLLRVKGHEVHTARDGIEAIEKASEIRPEVILMDIGMPKLNGCDATRRIRDTDHGRDIFIVAVTGRDEASDITRSREAGFSAHMVKPVDYPKLDAMLASLSACS